MNLFKEESEIVTTLYSTYLLISPLNTDEPLMFDAFTIILYFLFSLNFSLVKETLVNMMVRSELRSVILSSVFLSVRVISALQTRSLWGGGGGIVKGYKYLVSMMTANMHAVSCNSY